MACSNEVLGDVWIKIWNCLRAYLASFMASLRACLAGFMASLRACLAGFLASLRAC